MGTDHVRTRVVLLVVDARDAASGRWAALGIQDTPRARLSRTESPAGQIVDVGRQKILVVRLASNRADMPDVLFLVEGETVQRHKV